MGGSITGTSKRWEAVSRVQCIWEAVLQVQVRDGRQYHRYSKRWEAVSQVQYIWEAVLQVQVRNGRLYHRYSAYGRQYYRYK